MKNVMSLSVIILAAGRGMRMHSAKPKVLHLLAGKPLLEHVILQAQTLSPTEIFCVVGEGREQVMESLKAYPVRWIHQEKQLGTGHAVLQVLPHLNPAYPVLILYGDVPLISSDTLKQLLNTLVNHELSLLVAQLENVEGLGRIVRDKQGKIQRIVEERDATNEEKKIKEINTGVLAASFSALQHWLPKVTTQNNQHEYYLPDVINLAVAAGVAVITHTALHADEILGVNTRAQLAHLERVYQKKRIENLMAQGISFTDPARCDVRGEVIAEPDVLIESNVLFEGQVSLGEGTVIGPNNHIRDSRIGKNVVIKANCVIEEAEIADGCVIGPFSRIRPGTELKENVHIGSFVEVKKSKIGKGTKANHLTYLGDADIGEEVIIGAGTITCNYDGVDKHETRIKDRAFIGSNTALVAPVEVGQDAVIGAGSVITKDAPAAQLTLARSRQTTIAHWQKPKKRKKICVE